MANLGYAAAGVAVLLFGSNMMPVKRCRTGDGLFFLLVMCAGIWAVGLAVQLARGSPQFEPLAMLGGALWVSGQLLVVPIIRTLGVGLGMLIWGGTNLLTGWCTGRWGWFGVDRNRVDHPPLNAAGAALCVAGLAAFFMVRPTLEEAMPASKREGSGGGGGGDGERLLEQPINEGADDGAAGQGRAALDAAAASGAREPEGAAFVAWLAALPYAQRTFAGVVMALLAGVFFGANFTPSTYLMDHHQDAFGRAHSRHAMDYVFSHFCGILATGSLAFVAYAAAAGPSAYVPRELVLPAYAVGLMWGVAQLAFFVANQDLQFVVSYPLIHSGSASVGALWSILYFREIRGARNFAWLAVAGSLIVGGVTSIAVSAG